MDSQNMDRSATNELSGDRSFEEGLNPAPDGAMGEGEQMPEPERKPSKPSMFSKLFKFVLSGDFLSKDEVQRRYPYMLFVAFLILMYIGNVFRMQHLHRTEIRLQKQVKELRAKSLTLTSARMDITRQSNIIKMLQERGLDLEEALNPPKVITEE